MTRLGTLYQQNEGQPPVAIENGSMTAMQAALRYEARMLWREGAQYQERTTNSITMLTRDNRALKLYIEAPPPKRRSPGGGRKQLDVDEPTESSRVTMPASYWQYARQIGDGNTSLGIRRIIEAARDNR